MEWEVDAKMPRFEDRYHFDVWIGDDVREVRRTGNRENFFSSGLLVYTDCTHPFQNVICNEPDIKGWRLRMDKPVTSQETCYRASNWADSYLTLLQGLLPDTLGIDQQLQAASESLQQTYHRPADLAAGNWPSLAGWG